MNQFTFVDLEYNFKKKKTRREKFLEKMDAMLPWKELLKPVEADYPKGERDRPPIPAETMLRIYFMQQWYAMSDPGMEDSLYEIESMRRFACVDLRTVPYETTICKFRHYLEAKGLTEKLFDISRRYLGKRGLILREGSIVDASIVTAPSSTKNKLKERVPEMSSTKKGRNWHFGMKMHVGTDVNGMTHSVAVTTASVHDSVMMEEMLHGEEKEVYGDKAYVSEDKRGKFEGSGRKWRVNRKATAARKLSDGDKEYNRECSTTRSRVEHVFGVIKNLWGYSKTRYRGLRKNGAQVYTLAALANFYMARDKLLKLSPC